MSGTAASANANVEHAPVDDAPDPLTFDHLDVLFAEEAIAVQKHAVEAATCMDRHGWCPTDWETLRVLNRVRATLAHSAAHNHSPPHVLLLWSSASHACE